MKELAELYASSELYHTRIVYVYLAKQFREELAKLYVFFEFCPTRIV